MEVSEMLRLRIGGLSCKDIAGRAGCSSAHVSYQTNLLHRRKELQRRADKIVQEQGLIAAPLEMAGFGQRALRALRNEGAENLAEAVRCFLALIDRSPKTPGVGAKTVDEIRAKLVENNLLKPFPGGLYVNGNEGQQFPICLSNVGNRVRTSLAWLGYTDWNEVEKDLSKIESRRVQYGLGDAPLRQIVEFLHIKTIFEQRDK